MMDSFLEEVVTKKNKGLQNAAYVLANVAWVLLAVYAFLQLQNVTFNLSLEGFSSTTFIYIALFLVVGGAAVFIFLFRDRIKMEYEYTFTNGQMDFAQVYNNKKRKSLGTMNVRNVQACGMVASGSFQRYINMPGIKRTNWFLNRDAELFYFYFEKDGQKRIIIIEPSQEMVANIKKFIGQGVWQVN